MRIGVPKEIKAHEFRVGLTPDCVAELRGHGHAILVESGAGAAIGFSDADYAAAGGHVADCAETVFEDAELIVKVKEPQPVECARLRPHHVLFTYLHLAADAPQADALLGSGATCLAYETITDERGGLPLLRPMSEVAGRMSIQVGGQHLQTASGGRGILLGGVPGVPPARVAILGGGVAGAHAAEMAVGLQADVTIYDISPPRLAELQARFGGAVKTAYAARRAVEQAVAEADLVIGAVLVTGEAAPRLVTRAMLATMRPGAVLVDIAIDQGGCFETSRPTTHDRPTFVEGGVVHYAVANMPGAVPRTSTLALTNATLPFVAAVADQGAEAAMAADRHVRNGLNVRAGRIWHPGVAKALGLPVAS